MVTNGLTGNGEPPLGGILGALGVGVGGAGYDVYWEHCVKAVLVVLGMAGHTGSWE